MGIPSVVAYFRTSWRILIKRLVTWAYFICKFLMSINKCLRSGFYILEMLMKFMIDKVMISIPLFPWKVYHLVKRFKTFMMGDSFSMCIKTICVDCFFGNNDRVECSSIWCMTREEIKWFRLFRLIMNCKFIIEKKNRHKNVEKKVFWRGKYIHGKIPNDLHNNTG